MAYCSSPRHSSLSLTASRHIPARGAKLPYKALRIVLCALVLTAVLFPSETRAEKLILPPGASATLDKIYSFDLDGAIVDAQRLQTERPEHPLGYLLEAESLWWKIFCTSAEFKFAMTDARHRSKLAADQHYFDLAAKASSIALARLKTHETAEMQFYAGMADAFVARLDGLRGENRATARAGVHAREHFLRTIQLDPELVDAEFGMGLYNYYVDTLSAIAKFLGFFMGIPGGSKQEGIRQLDTISPKASSLRLSRGSISPWIYTVTTSNTNERLPLLALSSANIPPTRSFNSPAAISTQNLPARSRPLRATALPPQSLFRIPNAAIISGSWR